MPGSIPPSTNASGLAPRRDATGHYASFDVGCWAFEICFLTADYADNTDLTWNQKLIWKPRNHERSKKGKESGKEERRKALLKIVLHSRFPGF
ncbi:MAG: hypothetical protein DME75_04945 [Verrucomicrobia bacterium]|nr:MAG: hypothetical protein DME75_04945 [Verrucomicrobiota bacterium]